MRRKIEDAARKRFPDEVVEVRKTPDGYEVLVGPEGEHCYEPCELEDGEIDFEERD